MMMIDPRNNEDGKSYPSGLPVALAGLEMQEAVEKLLGNSDSPVILGYHQFDLSKVEEIMVVCPDETYHASQEKRVEAVSGRHSMKGHELIKELISGGFQITIVMVVRVHSYGEATEHQLHVTLVKLKT